MGGGLGAVPGGGLGAKGHDDDSESECEAIRSVASPSTSNCLPVFLSLGMPWANRPPSWGADSKPD